MLDVVDEIDDGEMRLFETGATRDTSEGKLDFEGFYTPEVMEAFGTYMNFNRHTANGTRDSDNWQKGIPLDVYMKSGFRHFFGWWSEYRGIITNEGVVWAICGLMFNLQGYLHTVLKADPELLKRALIEAKKRREAGIK